MSETKARSVCNPELFFALKDDARFATDISLRDLFAGMALAGQFALPSWTPEPPSAARWAYAYADALLLERERRPLPNADAPAGTSPLGAVRELARCSVWNVAQREAIRRAQAAGVNLAEFLKMVDEATEEVGRV